MTDWKTWFQKNKWGYLNNPSWKLPPTVIPENYNGIETEEPQVWTMPEQGNHQKSTVKTHHPCGHWHKPVVIPSTEYIQQDAPVTFVVYGSRTGGISYGGSLNIPCPVDWPPNPTLTSWIGELRYSDDGGGTFTSVAGTNSTFTNADPFPWTYSVALDPTIFNTPGRTFYLYGKADSFAFGTFLYPIYYDPTLTYDYATFKLTSLDYPYGETNSYINVTIQVGIVNVIKEALDVALFDRDTSLMIVGSNIHFDPEELRSEKSVVIPGNVFPFTHEVELRAKSDATNGNYAPYLQEASIYIDYKDITAFTNYQRVGVGSLLLGWGFAGNYDASPYPWNGQEQLMWPDPSQVDLWTVAHPPDDGFPGGFYRYGGIDASARQLIHKVSGVEVRYQVCMESYRGVDYPYDPIGDPVYDPAEEYLYQALWDNDALDNDHSVGNKVIAGSKVFLTAAELVEWQKRFLKTSGNIASLLSEGNRYCQFQPSDNYSPINPISAVILSTVRGTGGPIDLPDTFLYLLACTSYSSYGATPNPVTPPTSFRPWDPNRYDGTILSWFEVTYSNFSADAAIITLVDRSGNIYGTINIPGFVDPGGWPWRWYTLRVAIANLPTLPCDLGFSILSAGDIDDIYLKSVWVRIRQTGATKSRVHIPMLSFNHSWEMSDNEDEPYFGASAEVITDGVYLPNFDEPDYLNSWSWAMDACNIVKMG